MGREVPTSDRLLYFDTLECPQLENVYLKSWTHHPSILRQHFIGCVDSNKPLQLHARLGDNDISLDLFNSAHLQPFIEPSTKTFVALLHAAYPFTTEAGHLTSVYRNTFPENSEFFPFFSQGVQRRESLRHIGSLSLGGLTLVY